MPYPSNQPRYEFSAGDRTSLNAIAQSALNFMSNPPTRGNYDAMNAAIIALAPTYNFTPPLPDKR